ncbi:MAG: energy-coupling factor transporter transmembrane component T family protein [Bacteroidota bacterium]
MTAMKFIERLDPRTKFLTVLFMTLGILADGSIPVLLLLAITFFLATLSSAVSWKHIAKRMLTTLWFGILIILLNGISENGQVLIHVGGFYLTKEGTMTGVQLTAKLLLIVWASTLFVRSTPMEQMLDALDVTLHRFGRTSRSLGLIVAIALGFAPLLVHTAQRLKRAQEARGVDVTSGLSRKLRFALSTALPMFTLAYRSSERLALAMDSRCFDPAIKRSLFHRLALKTEDRIVLGGLVGLALTFFLFRIWPFV